MLISATEASPHSAPLTSIPPLAPPEQKASDPISVFAAFALVPGGWAIRSFLPAGAGVDSLPDIRVRRIAARIADVCALPGFLACADGLIAGPVARIAA